MGTFRQGLMAVLFVVTATMLVGPAAADDADTCAKDSGDVAIAACTRAITSGSNILAKLCFNRGVEYSNTKDYDRAIEDYDQAIRLNPQYAKAFNNRGLVYYYKQDYDRAIQDYDQAIRLNPQFAKAFNNRGLAKQKKGDTAGGDADIAKARQLRPKVGM